MLGRFQDLQEAREADAADQEDEFVEGGLQDVREVAVGEAFPLEVFEVFVGQVGVEGVVHRVGGG